MRTSRALYLLTLAQFLLAGCTCFAYHGTPYYRATLREIETGHPQPSERPQTSNLQAAATRIDITPPIGTPLQGFAARRGEPSTGIHDRLYARALVLQNAHSRVVLVSCDLMAVTKNLYDAVFERVAAKIGLDRSELILFATHTHSGAGGLSNRFAMQLVGGRFRPGLFRETVNKIADAIIEAANHTRPATISFGSGLMPDLNKNRAWTNAPVDRELKVLYVTDADARPLAWLVNYAAHPTIFGVNREFSADFPGYLAGELERGGGVCLFANGAAGDLDIAKQADASKQARAERAGKALAAKTFEMARAQPAKNQASITRLRAEVQLPPVRIRLGDKPGWALPAWLGNCLFPRRATLELVRIDRELLLTAPVEFCAGIGLQLKQAASQLGYDLFIIGYANDYLGYVVPENYYSSDAYEARTSFYGPRLDSYLSEIILKMMGQLGR